MSVYRPPETRIIARAALAVVIIGLLAGCSPDMERFAPDVASVSDRTPVGTTLIPPTGINGSSSAVPGNIPPSRPAPYKPVQVGSVTSAPLAAPAASHVNPRFAAPATKSPVLKSTAQRSAAAARPIPTGTARNLVRDGSWDPNGGTPVVVASGENLETLERRYGVPASTLLKVNGLRTASQVTPGTRITIPTFSRAGTAKSAAANATPRTSARTAAVAPLPKARPSQLSRKPVRVIPMGKPASNKPVSNKSASAKTAIKAGGKARETSAEHRARLKEERAKKLAGRKHARREATEKARKTREERVANKGRENDRKSQRQTAQADPAGKEPRKQPKTDSKPVGTIGKKAEAGDSAPAGNFRWPARGRIIRGFRKGQNDGINIAIPQGSAIKAAESGVVAYAGSELKGYGNLVLIRHPNGYVSAYAHASQIKVKRGDKVSRGQTIAAAGRTGNVSTPQLHFELRKGADPINPVDHLGSN